MNKSGFYFDKIILILVENLISVIKFCGEGGKQMVRRSDRSHKHTR